MERDNQIVIASGIIQGKFQRDTSPRGSGRIVRYDYRKELGLRHPVGYGFESYIIYKAIVDCYQVKVIRDVVSRSQRPTGKTTNYKNYGKAMRSLGYHPLYATGRIILSFRNSPTNAVQMLLGYLDTDVKNITLLQK